MNSLNLNPRQAHPFHLVDVSPWPFLMSFTVFGAAVGLVSWLGHYPSNPLSYLPALILIPILWWRDVLRESRGGYHTTIVQRGILIGFLLFLLSEIMLFSSFFWSWFHASLAPNIELGATWPAPGIVYIDAWSLPLVGTCILLASGFVLTHSHHAIILGNKYSSIFSLILTIVLGISFVYMQYTEYAYSPFTIADSVLGSVFYLLTGLHGLHVIIGVIFLTVGLVRIYNDHFTTEHHIGYEFAIYYWHLVDAVWLAVFAIIYWWSSPV